MTAKGSGPGAGGGSPSRPSTTAAAVGVGGSGSSSGGGGTEGTGTAPATGLGGSLHFGPPPDPLRYPNIDSLPCVQLLRAYCGKNVYTRSLLLMELAMVEENEPAKR